MILPAFTTVFPTDIFMFCLVALFYLVVAAIALAVLFLILYFFYMTGRTIWYALTGRWHIIKQEISEEFNRKN